MEMEAAIDGDPRDLFQILHHSPQYLTQTREA
jgi:hypothetical protein